MLLVFVRKVLVTTHSFNAVEGLLTNEWFGRDVQESPASALTRPSAMAYLASASVE